MEDNTLAYLNGDFSVDPFLFETNEYIYCMSITGSKQVSELGLMSHQHSRVIRRHGPRFKVGGAGEMSLGVMTSPEH